MLRSVAFVGGVWLLLMACIWWPYVSWATSPFPSDRPINVELPDLIWLLPPVLLGVAVTLERWSMSGTIPYLTWVVLSLTGLTILLWLVFVLLFALFKAITGSMVDAPELPILLGWPAFLCAVPLVNWMARRRRGDSA